MSESSSIHWAPLWSKQMMENRGLFLVSTPIGHYEDITLRALQTLRQVDGILCEDTRTTRQLLNHYGISKPCYSYHTHNEREKLNGIMARLIKGDRLALVSDRGTPLISDPGLLLVQRCHTDSIPVHIIGGVSSVIHGVVLSGFASGPFYFQGFMPIKKTGETWNVLANLSAPVVFFVAPHDLLRLSTDAYRAFGDRDACLVREMTKKFEQRVTLPLSQLGQWVQQADHLGECVLVISGKPPIIRIKRSKYVKDTPIEYGDSMDQTQVGI
jgi:16S rRNA (cytidine1402-2'-O)-methyltransferase